MRPRKESGEKRPVDDHDTSKIAANPANVGKRYNFAILMFCVGRSLFPKITPYIPKEQYADKKRVDWNTLTPDGRLRKVQTSMSTY